MTRRNVALTIVLGLLTCGLYFFYWNFVTTEELKARTGADLSPGLDLLLGIVTCGLWYFYTEYRNAQLVHAELSARGPHEDRAMVILILNIATLFVGVTGFIAIALLQEEYNKLADTPAQPQQIPPLTPAV